MKKFLIATVALAAAASTYTAANTNTGYESRQLTWASAPGLSTPGSAPRLTAQAEAPSLSASARTGARTLHLDYQWPSGHEVEVLRPFAPGAANWNAGHRGVDLAMNAGDLVYAAGAGTVIYSGALNDRSLVSIQHGDGIRTTYEPVVPMVAQGQEVAAGELIATVDGTHCNPRSCLHWGAKSGSKSYINPLSLLELPVIRLYE